MISYPRPGQRVQLWYNKRLAAGWCAAYHGLIGTVTTVSSGPGPRNVRVRIDRGGYCEGVIVPRGNLRELQEAKR